MTERAVEWWARTRPSGPCTFVALADGNGQSEQVPVICMPGAPSTAEAALQALLLGLDASRVTPPAADLDWMHACGAVRDAMAAMRPALGALGERATEPDLHELHGAAQAMIALAREQRAFVATGARAAIAQLLAQRLVYATAGFGALAYIDDLCARDATEKRLGAPVLASAHFPLPAAAAVELTIATLHALATAAQ